MGDQTFKVRALLRFPTRVVATNGVGVAVANGVYTFGFDYGGLLEINSIASHATAYIAVWDATNNIYRRISLTNVGLP